MPVVVGVDSSTQSCKVEIRDLGSGALLGAGAAPHPPAYGPESEQDPADWWRAFESALRAAVAGAGVAGRDIAAVSVAAQCHGLVPLAADGSVIRPAKLWNDTTCAPELAALREQIGAAHWIELTGSLPTAAFTAGKLAWLAGHEQAHFAALRRICLPHDWLTLQLSGQHVTDRSEASGTGYYSTAEARYLGEVLALVDPARDWAPVLPRVLGSAEPAGLVTAAMAERLGLGPATVIGAGGGDQQAAALGLAVRPGDVVYTIATSGVVFTVSPGPVFDAAGMVDGVADMADGYLPLVSTLNAARVTDWMAGLLGVDQVRLAEMALSADPAAVPAFTAFLDGERKPDRPAATGVLAGLTATTTREDLARAAHDGVLLALVRGERAMNSAGVGTCGRVLITGGGARSPAYRQILADLIGRPVAAAKVGEATARGAAVQAAAVAAGTSVEEVRAAWAPPVRVVAEPRPGSEHLRSALSRRYSAVANWAGFDGRAQSSPDGGAVSA